MYLSTGETQGHRSTERNSRRMALAARYSVLSLHSPPLFLTLLCLRQFLLCEEIHPFSLSPVVWLYVANTADLSVIHLWGRRAHCLGWGKWLSGIADWQRRRWGWDATKVEQMSTEECGIWSVNSLFRRYKQRGPAWEGSDTVCTLMLFWSFYDEKIKGARCCQAERHLNAEISLDCWKQYNSIFFSSHWGEKKPAGEWMNRFDMI